MMTSGSSGMIPAGYWNSIVGGWRYLLPPLAEQRVLCISPLRPSDSAQEAPLYAELSLLIDSQLGGIPTELEVAGAGAAGVHWRSIDSLLDRTATIAPAQRFDGLVVHDPKGLVVHRGNWPRLAKLLLQLPHVLRPEAFIYLGVPNSSPLSRAIARVTRHGKDPGQRPVPIATLLEVLIGSGFADLRVHPYLTSDSKLAEVIPQRGYRASKNRERPAARVKEFLFGPIGSRRLAPALGILAQAGTGGASTLDLIFEKVTAAPYYRGLVAPVVKNYLLFPGSKAIVTFGPDGRDDNDLVAILTTDALAIERRDAEMAVLSELANLPAHLATTVPRQRDRMTLGNTHCYVIDRLPGVTLDVDCEALDAVTDQAVEFAIDLHLASSQRVTIDESNYRRLFWNLVEAAQARMPSIADELQTWDEPLRACVMGAVLPTVWMHGDYKVENVMYEQRHRKLTGVIDWELARGPGLPLLDPLYLLIYNRQIRGEDRFQCIGDILWRDRCNAVEREQLRRYAERVGIAEHLRPALGAMFVMHHFGCRLHFGPDGASLEKARGVIRDARAMLERSAATAGTARCEIAFPGGAHAMAEDVRAVLSDAT